MHIISTYSFLSGGYLHSWLIHVHAICSSTYMYMKNVNDVTGWLSQTTDISKYFVWSPGLRDKESRLYIDQTKKQSDLGLYCLPRLVYPDAKDFYGRFCMI